MFAADYSVATCDFDLLDINENIAQYLPKECRDVSSDSDIYNIMLEEARLFKQFDDQLNEYEETLDTTYVPGSEDAVPEKQWASRFKFYNESIPCENRSDTQATYFECLIAERKTLTAKFVL